MTERLACQACGWTEARLQWQTFANGTRHIRAECRRCGRYIRFVPQTQDNVQRADREATSGPSGPGPPADPERA